MRSTINVLIVDDSALIRQILSRALALDPRIEIVGVAKNGVEAIEQAKRLDPDVITLDIEMPELTGLEALEQLPRYSSARVVMLSSLDDPETTYQALSLGAVDFIPKPRSGFATSIGELSDQLLKTIKTAYRATPRTVRDAEAPPADAEAASVASEAPAEPAPPAPADTRGAVSAVVAIASSTGGPPALERVFAGIDPAQSVAYLVVQHLPDGFATSLARRLAAVGRVPVEIAADGTALEPGRAYLAPYGAHLRVRLEAGRPVLRLDRETSAIHGVRPAADPLFESVAEVFGERAVGVVLTGMGTDGAAGLDAVRAAGGATIAQNEETSVVWGMPGAAVKRGAVRHVVPLGLVAVEIRRSLRGRV